MLMKPFNGREMAKAPKEENYMNESYKMEELYQQLLVKSATEM